VAGYGLAGGFLTGKYRPGGRPPARGRRRDQHLGNDPGPRQAGGRGRGRSARACPWRRWLAWALAGRGELGDRERRLRLARRAAALAPRRGLHYR
jgi:hypothetical protein